MENLQIRVLQNSWKCVAHKNVYLELSAIVVMLLLRLKEAPTPAHPHPPTFSDFLFSKSSDFLFFSFQITKETKHKQKKLNLI